MTKLLMVDESGAIMQEYGDVYVKVEGHPIEAETVMVVIQNELAPAACFCDSDPAGQDTLP